MFRRKWSFRLHILSKGPFFILVSVFFPTSRKQKKILLEARPGEPRNWERLLFYQEEPSVSCFRRLIWSTCQRWGRFPVQYFFGRGDFWSRFSFRHRRPEQIARAPLSSRHLGRSGSLDSHCSVVLIWMMLAR